jgi:hypothetical protein
MHILAAATIIALVVIISSVAYVYTSPMYSWNPAIRDHDGDGVPDGQDAARTNKTIWGTASAIIHVRMQFSVVNNQSYIIKFNGELEMNGWVNFSDSAVLDLTFTWLYGTVNSTSLAIDWICDGVHYAIPFHITESQTIPAVHDGMTYIVFLNGYVGP